MTIGWYNRSGGTKSDRLKLIRGDPGGTGVTHQLQHSGQCISSGHFCGVLWPPGNPPWYGMVIRVERNFIFCQQWKNCGEKPHLSARHDDDTLADVLVGQTVHKTWEDQINDLHTRIHMRSTGQGLKQGLGNR